MRREFVVQALVGILAVSDLFAADDSMMEDLTHPPRVGSEVALIRRYDIDPSLFRDYQSMVSFASIIKANDKVGLVQLEKQGKCRTAKKGTTALILERYDKPFPSAKVRIASGPEKNQIAFTIESCIDNLIPTRVRVGETVALFHEASLSGVGQVEHTVNVMILPKLANNI